MTRRQEIESMKRALTRLQNQRYRLEQQRKRCYGDYHPLDDRIKRLSYAIMRIASTLVDMGVTS